MIECTELPLTLCSDRIQPISISNSTRITADNSSKNKTFIQMYNCRYDHEEHLSLIQYAEVVYGKEDDKLFVPHFIGMNSSATYPVTASYARGTLIIHIPWRDMRFHKTENDQCIKTFYQYLRDHKFPKQVALNYYQAKHRFEEIKKQSDDCSDKEQNSEDDTADNDICPDDLFILKHLAHLTGSTTGTNDDDQAYDYGVTHDWNKRHTVSNRYSV